MEQYILEHLINSDSLIFEVIMIFFQLILEMKSTGKLFYISIPVAIFFSTAVVWLIKVIARNINNTYEAGVGFVIGSFFSFVTTFAAVLFLFSLQFTEPVVKVVIKGWELSLMANTDWRDKTFREAYENVADLKTENGRQLENFDSYPHPEQGGSSIPTHSEKAQLVATNTYLIAAENNFEKTMPFLSWILTAKSGTAKSDILNDMKQHFSKNNSSYLVSDAYKIASDRISKALLEQSGRIMIVGSILVFITWLLIQIIVIGLISWIALRSIKENFSVVKVV
ncbi:hypothetical protein [Photobacterium carnosum]|uniref:Uncharacterized protein n=2 Tax=Photobacterium carnosum TaxID=2023717 RepID=A0A2N4UME2_9GAMM|nr:hypothetical protein [Photobacterium carnosum]PLC56176.1 hypothetical protein CIK00_19850 [Photobacterium carnosum]